jgi:hypothetical protein
MFIEEKELLPGVQVSVKPSPEKKELLWAGVGALKVTERAQRGNRSKTTILENGMLGRFRGEKAPEYTHETLKRATKLNCDMLDLCFVQKAKQTRTTAN